MSSTNRHSGSVAFFSTVFCFFPHLIAVARISRTMLSKSGESWFSASFLRQRVSPVQANRCPLAGKGSWAHGDEDTSLTNHPSGARVSLSRRRTSHRDFFKNPDRQLIVEGPLLPVAPASLVSPSGGQESQVQQGRRTLPWAPTVGGAKV